MKTININILSFILILSALQLNAQHQSIDISFSARYYGQPMGLDSVLIRNINRNCDTIIYSPDTILSVLYTVGFNEFEDHNYNRFNISEPYPNPTLNNKVFVDLFLPDNGSVIISILNLKGIPVLKFKKYLVKGTHLLVIKLSQSGTFILKAVFNNEAGHKKIIALNNNYSTNSIQLVSGKSETTNYLKQGKNNKGAFWFEPGDTLWYVGYAKTPNQIFGSDVIESAPANDTLIRLSILEGVPCKRIEAVKHGGQLYATVQIGEQCWIKENMNIGIIVHGDTNMTDNGIIEKYCYDNNPQNCEVYGGLYQWDELMQYENFEGAQGICPDRWHVSTWDEWNTLIFQLSANELKETGSHHWLSGNNANNATGFTALPAGYKEAYSGTFEMIFEGCDFMTSTESIYGNEGMVMFQSMYYASSWIVGSDAWQTHGNSVRCVKD